MTRPAHEYHVGWPVDAYWVVRRVKQGLPVYLPTDPVRIDQRPYIRFATERDPDSA